MQIQANNRDAKNDSEKVASQIAIWHGLIPSADAGQPGPDSIVVQNRSPSPIDSVWLVDGDLARPGTHRLHLDEVPPCLVLGIPLSVSGLNGQSDETWAIYFRDSSGQFWQETRAGDLMPKDASIVSILQAKPAKEIRSETEWRAAGGALRDAADCK